MASDCFDPTNDYTILEGNPLFPINTKLDDTERGGHNIADAEYFIGVPGSDGSGTSMYALDLVFNSPVEWAEATVDTSLWKIKSSPYHISIHGLDELGNWGEYCEIDINVVSPTPTEGPLIIPVDTWSLGLFLLICLSGLLAQDFFIRFMHFFIRRFNFF